MPYGHTWYASTWSADSPQGRWVPGSPLDRQMVRPSCL
jgi:hypothetical protein